MFDEAYSEIDKQQKRIEALDKSPDDSKVMFGSKDYADTYIQKVDDFQDFVRSADVPDELKQQQFDDVAKFLKGIDTNVDAFIGRLTLALTIKLSDFKGEVEALDGELKNRYEVKSGDTLSKIVEKKLGITWKDDPVKFFSNVRLLHDTRRLIGSLLTIKDGKAVWELGTDDPNQLDVGEYLENSTDDNYRDSRNVDWYLSFSSSAPYERALKQELVKRVRQEDKHAGDEAVTSGAGVHVSTTELATMVKSEGKVAGDRDDAVAADAETVRVEADEEKLAVVAQTDEVIASNVFESVRPKVEEARGCVNAAERLLKGEEVSEILYSGLSASQLCLSAEEHYGEAYEALSEHLVANQEVLSPSSLEEVLLEMDAIKQEILGVEELQNVPKLQLAVANYPQYLFLNPETMAIVGNEAFQALPEADREVILKNLKENYGISGEDRILELNSEFCPLHQKEFHEGRLLIGQGEMTKAKPHLLAYVQAVEGGPFELYEASNLEIAKDHLVMIGQFEIAEMRGYLQKMQESLQLYMGGTLHRKRGLELTPLEAMPMLQTMRKVLDACEVGLKNGTVLTVEEARANIISSGKGRGDGLRGESLQAFQRDRSFARQIEGGVFDVFALFERLNSAEGVDAEREAILELARYYREHGLPEVASLLFDKYFAEEYQALQKENPKLSREYFEQGFERDPKLREDLEKKFEKQLESIIEDQLDTFRDGYDEENGVSISEEEARELLSQKITDEEKFEMKDQIKDQLVTDRWQSALKIGMLEKRDAAGVKDIFTEEYNDMMEFDRSWYEFWRMTDSQFDSLMENLWVEIVSLLLSFGAASRVSSAVMRRAVTRQLTKKIGKEVAEEMVEKALREGGEEALKALGRQMLGRGAMMGAAATAFAGENTAFVIVSGGLNGIRSGDFSQFTSVEGFAKAWGHSALTLGTLKGVGSVYGGTLGKLGTSPASMAGSSAVGQLGVRGGHMLGMNTAQVMALTGLGAGEMYLNGELSQGAVAESILQNTLITVAFTAAHAPQGRFQGRPVRGVEGQSPAEIARRLLSEHGVSLRPAQVEQVLPVGPVSPASLEAGRRQLAESLQVGDRFNLEGPDEMRVPDKVRAPDEMLVSKSVEQAQLSEGRLLPGERAKYIELLGHLKSHEFGARVPVDSFVADALNRTLKPGDVLQGEYSSVADINVRLDAKIDSSGNITERVWQGTDLSTGEPIVVHINGGSSIALIHQGGGRSYLHDVRSVNNPRAVETLRSLAVIEIEVLGKAPGNFKYFEPPGNFEPGAEFARIRAMPKSSRSEAIRLFRERSHEQQLELGKIPDRVRDYVGRNPDATLIEVTDNVLGTGRERLRFSSDQRVEIMERISQYMHRREAVQRYAKDYKGREKELLALIFGKNVGDLSGDVRIEVHDASLFFDIADSRTFDLISGIEGAALDTAGFAFAYSEIAELKGAVTIGNNLGIKFGYISRSVVAHEVRHAENKLLFPEGELGVLEKPIYRAKDEIIAYMRDGSSKEGVLDVLTKKDGLYDYFRNHRKDHLKRMSELAFSSPDGGLKIDSAEYVEFMANKDAITQIDAQWEAHVRQVRDLVEIAFQVGPSNLDLLAVTPHKQWRRLKVEKIRAGEEDIRVESLSFQRAMVEAFKEMSDPIVSEWERSWSALRSGSKSVGDFLSGTKEALGKLEPEIEVWKARLPMIPDFEVWAALREQYDALVAKVIVMKESMQVARLERAVSELEGIDLSSLKTPEARDQFNVRLVQLKERLQGNDKFKDNSVNEYRDLLITRLDRVNRGA